MFSARQPTAGEAIPPSLFPDPLPEGQAYHDLIDRVTHDQLICGKPLSDDGKWALFVLPQKPEVVDSKRKGSDDPAIAVARPTALVGPVLIPTTPVLVRSLPALVFSSLPARRLFGWLSALAMAAALAVDLLILRPRDNGVAAHRRAGARASPLGSTSNQQMQNEEN